MLKIRYHTQFKKDYKKIIKRGYNDKLLDEVLEYLINEKPLPSQYKDHQLIGNYKDYRECHILNDWLLVYKVEKEILTLVLFRTGTHSDLFNK